MPAPVSNASVLFAAGFQMPGAAGGPAPEGGTAATGFEALLGMMLGQSVDEDAASQDRAAAQQPMANVAQGPLTAPQDKAAKPKSKAGSTGEIDIDPTPAAPATLDATLMAGLMAPASPILAQPAATAGEAQDIAGAISALPRGAGRTFEDAPPAMTAEEEAGAALEPAADDVAPIGPTPRTFGSLDEPARVAVGGSPVLQSADASLPAAPRAQAQATTTETAPAIATAASSDIGRSQAEASAVTAASAPTPRSAQAPETRRAEPKGDSATQVAAEDGLDPASAPRPGAQPVAGQAKSAKTDGKAGSVDVATRDLASPQTEEIAPTDDSPDSPVRPTETSTTAGAAPVAHAATHVVRGSPETVASLAAQIVRKLDARTTRFDVQLDPIGLGHVDVRVEINAQGRITAALAFDNPQAAAEVRARSNELQKALEQAGFDVTGGLSFDLASDQGRSGQSGRGLLDEDAGAAFRGRAFQNAMNTNEAADAAAGPVILRRRDTGVDVRI